MGVGVVFSQPEWYRALQAQDEVSEFYPAVTQPLGPPKAPGPKLSEWQGSLQAPKPSFISTQPLKHCVVGRARKRPVLSLDGGALPTAKPRARMLALSHAICLESGLSAGDVGFSMVVSNLGLLEEFC